MIALLRLETAGVVRARWLTASFVMTVAAVGFFFALASRESAIVAFTGFERVVTGFGSAALLLLPLLAILATSQAIVQARAQGVLEWYLSHPVSRPGCFWAIFLPRLAAVAGPVVLAVALIGLASAALGQAVSVALLARLVAVLVGQAVCFAALGFWVGVGASTPESALLRGLGLWITSAALLDFALIGAMLRWNIPVSTVFALSAINPVQAGRLGLLSGADPELGVLGPVGTWISTTLGSGGTLTYALAWPMLVGAVALFAARRQFLRGDLL